MGLTVSKFWDLFSSRTKSEMRILMLGLDAAGKTSILYKLQIGEAITTVPTIGFNVESLKYKNFEFQVWDLGGQSSIRPYWRCYYANTQVIIYVVDSTSSPERLEITKQELLSIMREEELKDAKLLVFANKQDLQPKALKPNEVLERLELHQLTDRDWTIFGTSAVEDDINDPKSGLHQGFEWLTDSFSTSTK